MNFLAERQAIVGRLLANWTTTPVRLENQPANPAADLSQGYVALWIRTGQGRQATLGPVPGLIFAGLIMLQVFTPHTALNGNILGLSYASTLAGIFRLQQFQVTYLGLPSGVIGCGVPEIVQPSNQEQGWWLITVECPYFRQIQHT